MEDRYISVNHLMTTLENCVAEGSTSESRKVANEILHGVMPQIIADEPSAEETDRLITMLKDALEIINSHCNCEVSCRHCKYGKLPDCPKEQSFKWQYADEVEKLIKGDGDETSCST